MGSNANTQGAPPPQGGFVQTDIPTTPEGMKKKILNLGTIITLVAGILVLIGTFMAWLSVSEYGFSFNFTGMNLASGTFEGMDMGTSYPEIYIVPIMGILIILMPFIKFPIGSMIMGIIAMLIPIEVLARIDSGFSYIGIGAILCIVGGIIAIVGGPLAHKMSKVIPLPPQ